MMKTHVIPFLSLSITYLIQVSLRAEGQCSIMAVNLSPRYAEGHY